ncbi:MAG: hypothetical protein AVDCRST_MAG12-3129, partial [uncultured Rubrobacteraceae bacterium]
AEDMARVRDDGHGHRVMRRCGFGHHQRAARRQPASQRRWPRQRHPVLRRHLALLLGDPDLAHRLPDRRALRRRREQGGGHLRSRLRGRGQDLRWHVLRGSGLPRHLRGLPRHRRGRARQPDQGHQAG